MSALGCFFFSRNLISSFVMGSTTSGFASSDVLAAKLNRADRLGLCYFCGASNSRKEVWRYFSRGLMLRIYLGTCGAGDGGAE